MNFKNKRPLQNDNNNNNKKESWTEFLNLKTQEQIANIHYKGSVWISGDEIKPFWVYNLNLSNALQPHEPHVVTYAKSSKNEGLPSEISALHIFFLFPHVHSLI